MERTESMFPSVASVAKKHNLPLSVAVDVVLSTAMRLALKREKGLYQVSYFACWLSGVGRDDVPPLYMLPKLTEADRSIERNLFAGKVDDPVPFDPDDPEVLLSIARLSSYCVAAAASGRASGAALEVVEQLCWTGMQWWLMGEACRNVSERKSLSVVKQVMADALKSEMDIISRN